MSAPNPEIGSVLPPRAAEVEPLAAVLHASGSSKPSVAQVYRDVRGRRLIELLGLWVSELEPIVFERVDVSPQVLAQLGIAPPGATVPMFVREVTVGDIISAGGLG